MAVVAATSRQESFAGGPQQTFINIPGSQLTCAGQMNCLMCHKDVWISCQPQGHVLVVLHHGNAPTSDDDHTLKIELDSGPFSEVTHERLVSNSDAVVSHGFKDKIDTNSACSMRIIPGPNSAANRVSHASNDVEEESEEDCKEGIIEEVVNSVLGNRKSPDDNHIERLPLTKVTESSKKRRRKDLSIKAKKKEKASSSQAHKKKARALEKTRDDDMGNSSLQIDTTVQSSILKTQKKTRTIRSKHKRDRSSVHLKVKLKTPREETPAQYYHCELCNSLFKGNSVLKKHIRNHIEPRDFVCDVCGKAFRERCEINRHKRVVHESIRPHICDVCGKAFAKRAQVKDHRNIHFGIKLHVCHLCGKSFSFKTNLYRHMVFHSGEKAFSCKFCGKKFFQKSNMLVHQRYHTGETPFCCEICGKGYRDASHLKTHLIAHAKGKSRSDVKSNKKKRAINPRPRPSGPFNCDSCPKVFPNNQRLEQHRRVHTGEKPFECPTCGRTFNSRANKVRHELVHSGEKPHRCDICGRDFSQKPNLKAHLKTHNK